MFDKDIKINGIYATHLKSLAKDRDGQNVKKPYIFERYIDVYETAAIVGLLEGSPIMKPDFTVKDTVQIMADAFIREQETCMFIYRLVMLLDRTTEITDEERIDRAFRDDGDLTYNAEKIKINMNLFNAYVYSGIEKLYSRIMDNVTNQDGMLNNIEDWMDHFHKEYICCETPDEYLKSMKK
ncbi:hypothetical protein [uncultured Dialister sp.]|uniref:hypothetical protein n=1 Tax=uncultured Dialister sp. TaxID=278064 RepID=UPI00258E1202|nr:hypothetical protein [uncultured Dialister sp.]